MFLEFLESRGGTPYKRVPEGFFDKLCVLIFTLQNRVRSMFLDFLDSRGGGGGPLINMFLRAFSAKFAF